MKKKLRLHRETLRNLQGGALPRAAGAAAAVDETIIEIGKTNEISICVYCTTPLDTCPQTQPYQTCTVA